MSKYLLPLLMLICLSLLITGCQTAANTQPTTAPNVVTIEVDGELILLIPGENVAPELYELVRTNPEFAAGVEWVLINDIWEPIARGVTGPLEAEEPFYRDPIPTPLPGLSEDVQLYSDPLGRFSFEHPANWTAHPLSNDLAEGTLVMDTQQPEQATRWASLEVFPNPNRASLKVWLAENGPARPGKVIAESELSVHGLPLVRQVLVNEGATYLLVWQPGVESIYLWTAWPGEQPETINLLERMLYSFQSGEYLR